MFERNLAALPGERVRAPGRRPESPGCAPRDGVRGACLWVEFGCLVGGRRVRTVPLGRSSECLPASGVRLLCRWLEGLGCAPGMECAAPVLGWSLGAWSAAEESGLRSWEGAPGVLALGWSWTVRRWIGGLGLLSWEPVVSVCRRVEWVLSCRRPRCLGCSSGKEWRANFWSGFLG